MLSIATSTAQFSCARPEPVSPPVPGRGSRRSAQGYSLDNRAELDGGGGAEDPVALKGLAVYHVAQALVSAALPAAGPIAGLPDPESAPQGSPEPPPSPGGVTPLPLMTWQ